MPSPFPGMDPYIESSRLWEDFHEKFISEIESTLAGLVPDNYVVRLAERAYVVLMPPEDAGLKQRHVAQGDVTILGSEAPHQSHSGNIATLAPPATETTADPVEMTALISVEFREVFAEIYEIKPNRKLVTTIEVLSPSNKRRDTLGWTQYARKRQAHLEGNVNLVEMDLLRAGTRMEMVEEWPNSPYYLLVCRREMAPTCKVWRSYYMHRLPDIPVPLSLPDDDVVLPIQPLVDKIYARSKYDLDIDYSQPCQPPLEPEGAEWFAKRLREHGPS